MQHISLDMVGPLPIAKQFKFILVIIYTFTRYVELYSTKDVTAGTATHAFGTPLEIMTDYGSQFINKTQDTVGRQASHETSNS